MWVNPEQIGEDSESLVLLFRSSNSADRVPGQTFGRGILIRIARHIDPNRRDQSQASRGGPDRTRSPEAVLTDTVARLPRDLDEMKVESRYLWTPGTRDSLRQPRQVIFTSTKVPKFACN